MTRLCLVLMALVMSAGSHAHGAAPADAVKPLVVLIGIDGFRADYLGRGHSPVLLGLANQGTVAHGLTPVFPSNTFPNHVSLVTGRFPGHHGILNNTMVDPLIPHQVFRLRDRAAVTNPAWWSEVEPIWVTAGRQGRISSTLFWPGTEVSIGGRQPRDWLPYQHELTSMQRASQLLQWLTDIRPDRPQADFATLYVSEVDSEGHAHGPDSPEVNEAIARVDLAIGHLIDGLRAAGLWHQTTLVVVSDHGMSLVPANQVIDGAALLKPFPRARWEWIGATPGVALGGESQEAVLATLAAAQNLTCWPKGLAPRRLGPLLHRRVPDIVCLAAAGWSLNNRLLSFPIPGQHGFDPEHTQMQGLFIAHGPTIKPVKLGRTSSLEVYPLLCALLGIEPAAHDASGILASQVLRE
ncbi:MAG: ectonucleotide pyrophosphatase/phosphodiesterase [Proteobacteria bacterium]|nr:ectonucleotide pyrophosphatase/phosphodiesterase [Pseudomonadota bacterium]